MIVNQSCEFQVSLGLSQIFGFILTQNEILNFLICHQMRSNEEISLCSNRNYQIPLHWCNNVIKGLSLLSCAWTVTHRNILDTN